MKKFIILPILFSIAFIQVAKSQTYKQNKIVYDYHNYMPEIGDPYNP